MVKDHSDSENETRCRHIGYSYRLTPRVLLYAPSHRQDSIVQTTAFVTPVVEHWLQREIAQWVHPMKDRSDDPSHHERTLYLRAIWRLSVTIAKCSRKCLSMLRVRKCVPVMLTSLRDHLTIICYNSTTSLCPRSKKKRR